MDQNSPWGMVVHSASEWDISELHKGGVAFLRIDFRWDALQPTASTTTFAWLHFDRIVRWAVDRGVFILAGLHGTPQWAVDPARMTADQNKYRPDAYPARDLGKWENYVRQVVARYSARGVRHWSIWNEPDSHDEPADVCFWRGRDQQEFFDGVLKSAMKVLGEFSNVLICGLDVAKAEATPVPWHPHWTRDLLTQHGRKLHAVTVHAYAGTGDGSDVVDRAKVAKALVDSYNANNGTQIQLWITETGWHTPQHTEAVISSKMQDLVREVRRNPWVRKVFPYVWSDDFNSGSTFKAGVRLLRERWTGYKSAIAAPQPAVPLERDSVLVSHNVPVQFTHGQTYNVQMKFRNTGRWTWPQGGTFRLGFASIPVQQSPPFQGIADAGYGQLLAVLTSGQHSINAPVRVAMPAAVATSGEVTISFSMTMPAQAGYHVLGWGLVHEPPPGPDTPPDAMFFGQGLFQRSLVG